MPRKPLDGREHGDGLVQVGAKKTGIKCAFNSIGFASHFLRMKRVLIAQNFSQKPKENAMDIEVKAFRVSEFCQRYVISKASFYREVAAERIIITKRGRTTLITTIEAERWFSSLCQGEQEG